MEEEYQDSLAALRIVDSLEANLLENRLVRKEAREREQHEQRWGALEDDQSRLRQRIKETQEALERARAAAAEAAAQRAGGLQQVPMMRTEWRLKRCPDGCPCGFVHIVGRDANACAGIIRVCNAVQRGGAAARPEAMMRRKRQQ